MCAGTTGRARHKHCLAGELKKSAGSLSDCASRSSLVCQVNASLRMCSRGTKQERAAERDEQWEAQQEVLKRRRGNLWQNVSVLLSQQYINLV